MAFVSNAYHSDLKHDLRNRNPVGASYFIPIEINKYAWQTHNPKYVLYSFNALKILNILLLKSHHVRILVPKIHKVLLKLDMYRQRSDVTRETS